MNYADKFCTYTEDPKAQTYTFSGVCRQTGKPYSVTVPAKELFAYRQGESIQKAMPSVSRDDREFLMSGYSPEGWNAVFGDDE